MKKDAIIEALSANHEQFIHLLLSLPAEKYLFEPNGKWSPGQHLEHIFRAVQPVNLALRLPAFLLRWMFGRSNRPSKSYEGLIEKYHTKLAEGGRASGRFIPPPANWAQRLRLVKRLHYQIRSLILRVSRHSENQLDTIILPHPLLGKVTLREMLYFTMYHVTHHQTAIERDLQFSTR